MEVAVSSYHSSCGAPLPWSSPYSEPSDLGWYWLPSSASLWEPQHLLWVPLKLFISLNCFCLFFRTAPGAYGGSQARGQIRAPAAGRHHSHSNMRSKSCLQPTPQLTSTLDLRPTDQGQGLNPRPQGHYCITTGTSELFFTEPFLWDSASFWSPDCTGPRELGCLHLGVRHLALDALLLLGRSLGHA